MPAGPLGLLPARACPSAPEGPRNEAPDRADPRAEHLQADRAVRDARRGPIPGKKTRPPPPPPPGGTPKKRSRVAGFPPGRNFKKKRGREGRGGDFLSGKSSPAGGSYRS